MTDDTLTVADQKEALSRVYARAVAAGAGYTTSAFDFDRDGVDLQIEAAGRMRPNLALQLKATVNLSEPRNGSVQFRLNRRNYDLLIVETQVPRLLMVLDLPQDEQEWMTITRDSLVLRRRAYWLNLRGYEETTNTTSVTVSIPTTNIFDVESLRDLMDQSREGKIR